MDCERYLAQAQSNEEAARSIENDYPDWTVTMCFYAALHWVEYYACQRGDNIRTQYQNKSPHDSRRSYVYDLAEELNNTSLRKLYGDLEDASRKARYLERVKYSSAINYFKGHKSEVGKSFDQLQQIKDILNKIK